MVLVLSCACASAFAAWDWSGKTGDVELTEDATVTDADVSTVAALTGIAIPSGRTLTLANTATELVLKANLSGAGGEWIEGSGSVRIGDLGLSIIVK